MTCNTEEPPNKQIIPPGDLLAMRLAFHQLHAQIRLITAADFASFLSLSPSEQLSSLQGLLSLSQNAIEIFDHLPHGYNPDQG